MAAALTLGPWGGKGGIAFDDGCSNGGVTKVIIYSSNNILGGFEVYYGDGTSKVHGSTSGKKGTEVWYTEKAPLENVGVYAGKDERFEDDPDRVGVLHVGFSAWNPPPLTSTKATEVYPPPLPPGAVLYRPQVLGFFGRATAAGVDSLGFYLSKPAPTTHE